MGSKEIWNLEYRESFAFVGTRGKLQKYQEQKSSGRLDEVSVTTVYNIEG